MKKVGIVLCGKEKLFQELTKTALQNGEIYYERYQSMILEYFYIEALKKESIKKIPRQFLEESCIVIIETLSLEAYLYIKQRIPQVCILTKHLLEQLLKVNKGIFIGRFLELTSMQIKEAILLFEYINDNHMAIKKCNTLNLWYGYILKEEGALKMMQILLNYVEARKECHSIQLQLLANSQVPAYWQYELEDAMMQYFNEEISFEVTTACIAVQTNQIYYVVKTF